MDKFCNKIPYAINVSTGEVIEADFFDAINREDISCPYCKDIVIHKGSYTQNKDGTDRKKHFSHKSKAICVNKVSSEGESLAHREGKEYIYNLLSDLEEFSEDFKLIKLKKEYQLINNNLDVNRITDIYCEFTYKEKLYKQAYEIQYSNIEEEELSIRHNDYSKLGVEDIWFVGLQFKKMSKKDEKDKSFYNGVAYKGDVTNDQFHYNRGDNSRTFPKYIFVPIPKKETIMSKSISLFKKISCFQDNVYFINTKGLFLPKVVDTHFIGAKSNYLYKERYTLDLEEYSKNISTGLSSNSYNIVYYSMLLGTTKVINSEYKFDNCLVEIPKKLLNLGFFINGDNKLFHKDKAELSYHKEIKIEIQKEIDLKNKHINYEKNIIDYKYSVTEFAQIYLIRLISTFLKEINGIIYINKQKVGQLQGDSLKWLNKTLLNKRGTDIKTYGFFSTINTVIESMTHITPQYSLILSDRLINSLNDIVTFIDNNKADIYTTLNYDLFINQLGIELYKNVSRIDKSLTNKVDGLYDDSFRYGIRLCLQNYCSPQIKSIGKGNINKFLFISLFGENYSIFKNNFIREHKIITDFYEEIEETYGV